MYQSERAHGMLHGGGDSSTMEDWCGVFLDGLDGLESSPTVERAAAAAAAARELSSPVDDETTLRRARSVPQAEPVGAELIDKLGKRARAAQPEPDAAAHAAYGGYGLNTSPLPPRFPGGGLGGSAAHGGLVPMLRTHRSGGTPAGMGPYRSASIQSIESTLSNHIDHALDDDDDDDELGDNVGGLGAPPHKKGPASLPAAAPGLYRRAFSEGAQQDDHDVWQSASGGYDRESPQLAEAAKDDDNSHEDANDEWGVDGDGTEGDATGSRAGQKTAPWTRTEDQVISEAVKRFGCKWGVLSALLPGRTDNAVRNRWHRLERARKWREENASRRQQSMGAFGGAVDLAACAPLPPTPLALAPSAGPRTSGNGGYKCGRCGQPKRGHLCTVTLESDQLVYEAAQDKMRELHLQQVDTKQPRPATAMAVGRRKAPHVKEEGGSPPQYSPPLGPHNLHHYHHFVQHGMPINVERAPPHAMPPPPPQFQEAPLSAAAQRQAAQRAQAQAQRQHQLAMQAQLQAHHAAQLATHAQHARPHARAVATPHAHGYATAVYAQPEPVAHMTLFGQATVLGVPTAPKRSRVAQLRHDAEGQPSGQAPPAYGAVQPSRPQSGGSQSDERAELDLLAIKPDELLQIQSLFGSHELDAGAGFELSGEQLGSLHEAVDEDADCALSIFVDGRISVFIPPSLDRAISAPAGLLLDDAQLGASRWPQTPGSTNAKSKSHAAKSASGGGSSVPSPTATAA